MSFDSFYDTVNKNGHLHYDNITCFRNQGCATIS